MKLPKNKAWLMAVIRTQTVFNLSAVKEEVTVAICLTMEGADELAASMQQDFEDRGITEYTFSIAPIIYYDR